jgi:TolB-like protein/tetratricopeptide (TPR) repeat protein
MAPEQLHGTRGDPRSDLFSVGVILYEMATGRLPWDSRVPADLIREILDARSVPPSERGKVSSRFDAPIMKALEKSPARRYATARAFLDEWSAEGGPCPRPRSRTGRWILLSSTAALLAASIPFFSFLPPRIDPRSVAVLPLRNLSSDREQEFFADGMTEELITKLSQVGGLKVISTTTSLQLKGTKLSIQEIARRVKVRHVVEGSVQREGDHVRISAMLVDASQDHPIWANTYERDFQNVLGLEAEMAQVITGEVLGSVTPEVRAMLGRVPEVRPEAHEAYLHGLNLWKERQPRDLDLAVQYYKRAIALDPGYAQPHAALADVYDFLGNVSQLPQDQAHQLAKQEALQALALDDSLAEAHASLAELRAEYEWDWPGAEKEFLRAIELNPGHAMIREWYAEFLSRSGRRGEALTQIKKALELDPLSPPVVGMLGTVYLYGGQTDRAIECYRRAIELRPDVLTRLYLGMAYLDKRLYPQAVQALEQAVADAPGLPIPKAVLGCAYGLSGRGEDARKILADLEERSKSAPVPPTCMAFVWIGLGNKDEVFRWLERAYVAHDSYLGHLKVAPIVDGLRDDPRFADLLRRVGLGPNTGKLT